MLVLVNASRWRKIHRGVFCTFIGIRNTRRFVAHQHEFEHGRDLKALRVELACKKTVVPRQFFQQANVDAVAVVGLLEHGKPRAVAGPRELGRGCAGLRPLARNQRRRQFDAVAAQGLLEQRLRHTVCVCVCVWLEHAIIDKL